MKKIYLLAITLLLVCGLTACANKKNKKNKKPVPDASVGGYSIENPIAGKMPDAAKNAFDEAVGGLDGVSYTPLACVGQQVVSGTNYYILALSRAVSPDAESQLKILKVYKGPGAKAVLQSSEDFILTDYIKRTGEIEIPDNFIGGIRVPAEGGLNAMPQDLASAVSSAFTKTEGISFEPLACVGRQVVSGTNYALVCRGISTDDSTKSGLFMVVVYNDLKGNASVLSACPIDVR